jgi:hypothetical protein
MKKTDSHYELVNKVIQYIQYSTVKIMYGVDKRI